MRSVRNRRKWSAGLVLVACGLGVLVWQADRVPPGARGPTPDLSAPGREAPVGLVVGEVRVDRTKEPASAVPVGIANGAEQPSTETGAGGRFRLEVPGGVGVTLRVGPWDRFAAVEIPGIEVIPGTLVDLGTLYLAPPARLHGRVVSWEGSPVPGAEVLLRRHRSGLGDDARGLEDLIRWHASAPAARGSVTTGEGGRFSIDDLPAGTWDLEASADGLAPAVLEAVPAVPRTAVGSCWDRPWTSPAGCGTGRALRWPGRRWPCMRGTATACAAGRRRETTAGSSSRTWCRAAAS